MKPFSQACENNKQPILQHLRDYFCGTTAVLEIGSGTGQHAVHFAQGLEHLIWQCSDQPDYHAGILAWLNDCEVSNIRTPLAYTVGQDPWPDGQFDGVFSANTAHIMQREEVRQMMYSIASNLPAGGVFCQYGPFTQNHQFNSASNEQFHQHLISQGYGGYRDITELQEWASPLILQTVIDMPANNHLLVWSKPKQL